MTAHVRALRQSGRVVALVGAPDSDVVYYATVWPRSDGTVGTRLELVTDVSRSPRDCAISATWSVREDTVEVSVPQSCLQFGRFLEQHYVQVRMSDRRRSGRHARGGRRAGQQPRLRDRRRDPAPAPRCQPKARVHALLDTAGRFGDGAAGGYSRIYGPAPADARGTSTTTVRRTGSRPRDASGGPRTNV